MSVFFHYRFNIYFTENQENFKKIDVMETSNESF